MPDPTKPPPPAEGATKVCRKCWTEKPHEDFCLVAASRDGRHIWCRPCKAIEARRYYTDHAGQLSDSSFERHVADPRLRMVRAAKERSRKLGIPFDLEVTDLTVPEKCPALGIPLFPKRGSTSGDNSPSLDRLHPSLGYVKNNVIVVSSKANRIKNDSTIDELEAVAAFYARHIAPAPSPRKRRNPA